MIFNKISSTEQVFYFNQLIGTLQNCIVPFYRLMMCGIIMICVCLSNIRFGRSSFCKNYFPAALLLIFGTVFLSGLYVLCKKICAINHKKELLILLSISVFFLQVYAVYNYYFYTDWDVPHLINLSNAIVHNEDVTKFSRYFSRYPNNLFLVQLFSIIRRFIHIAGLHKYEYHAILIVQCFLNTITGLLLVGVLKKLFNNSCLIFMGYIMYIFLIGASPWVSIPYSDSMGLIFPILILHIYLNMQTTRHQLIHWILLTFLSFIGYKIKPQIFIIFISIIMIEFMNIFITKTNHKVKNKIAGIIGGMISALILSQVMISSLNIPIDVNQEFGIKHFFMMGMNPQDMGVWSGDDVNFSASFPTLQQRNDANMEIALDRINHMGIQGIAKQFIRKTLTNYYDGTFCWSGEGTFFIKILEERNNPLCKFFRGLYYTKNYSDIGKYYVLWSNFEQMIWLTVLLFNIFSTLSKKVSDKNVIMLGIIGLTIFELIFEARARYLFTYAPLYIILALDGYDYFITRFCIFTEQKAQNNIF